MLMNTGSIIRYENWEPIRQGSLPELTSRLRLDVAENLAAAFDLDLAVADRSRDPAGRLDQEPVADDQITFEAAVYLGLVDRCRARGQRVVVDGTSANRVKGEGFGQSRPVVLMSVLGGDSSQRRPRFCRSNCIHEARKFH